MAGLLLGWACLLAALAVGPTLPVLGGVVLAVGLLVVVVETWRQREEG